jgi:hypothetical protein
VLMVEDTSLECPTLSAPAVESMGPQLSRTLSVETVAMSSTSELPESVLISNNQPHVSPTRLLSIHRTPPQSVDTLFSETAQGLLRSYGLAINMEHHIVICRECGFIINPSRVREHIMNAHRHIQPPLDLQKKFNDLLNARPRLTYQPPHPKAPIECIPELKRPIPACLICSVCHKGYQVDQKHPTNLSKPFKQHCCIKGEQVHPNRTFSIHPAQRFGTHLSWFAVCPPQCRIFPTNTPWNNYQAMLSTRPPPSMEISVPENYRILHQFLHKERWLDHVAGLDLSTIRELSGFSAKEKVIGSLQRRIHAYLAVAQGKLKSYVLRRLIGTRPSSEHAHTFQKHHEDVNYDSHRKYALIVAASIALLLRVVNNPLPQYHFSVGASIETKARALYTALEHSEAGTEQNHGADGYDDGHSVMPDIQRKHGEEEEDEDNDEEYSDDPMLPDRCDEGDLQDTEEDYVEDPHVTAHPYGMSETRRIPQFDDNAQKELCDLLKLLYVQHLGTDHFRSVFVRYVLLSSVKESSVKGNVMWRGVSEITHRIAALLFTGRLVLATVIHAEKAMHPSKMYSVCV